MGRRYSAASSTVRTGVSLYLPAGLKRRVFQFHYSVFVMVGERNESFVQGPAKQTDRAGDAGFLQEARTMAGSGFEPDVQPAGNLFRRVAKTDQWQNF